MDPPHHPYMLPAVADVQIEMKKWNRTMGEVTAHTGYAGAKVVGHDGRVCYHHDTGDQSDDCEVSSSGIL